MAKGARGYYFFTNAYLLGLIFLISIVFTLALKLILSVLLFTSGLMFVYFRLDFNFRFNLFSPKQVTTVHVWFLFMHKCMKNVH